MKFVQPMGELKKEEKKLISMISFPDSNSFVKEGVQKFLFKF